MKFFNINILKCLLALVCISLFTGGCLYTEDSYLKQVKKAKKYQDKSQEQQKKIEDLENKLTKIDKEKEKAVSQMNKKEKQCNEKIDLCNVENQKLKEQMDKFVEENNIIRKKFDATLNHKDLLIKEIKKSQRHNEKLKNQLEDMKKQAKNLAKVKKQTERSQQIQKEVIQSLKQEISEKKVKITQLADMTTIIRLNEKILFDSGKSFIKASGFPLLDKVALVLKKIKDRHIQVVGHTDNRKIGHYLKKKYPTNWELSVSRATTVLRYLVDIAKINAKRISAAGYGSQQPIAKNSTFKGRQLNRRVEFVLLPVRAKEIQVTEKALK